MRGSLERLTPVLMTALSAGLALIPLLFGADEPGREILHPVAVTIFGGLLSATALDTLLTPLLFLAFGRKPLERLTEKARADGHAAGRSLLIPVQPKEGESEMILRALMIAAVSLTLMASADAQTKGPNGGIVVKVEDHPVEFVLRDQEIVFYIGDHDGKPMSTKGLKARAVVQVGGKTLTIALSPAAPNMFVGKLTAPLGSKARVVFSGAVDGHTLQARFVTP